MPIEQDKNYSDDVVASGTRPISGVGILERLEQPERGWVKATIFASDLRFVLDTRAIGAWENAGQGAIKPGDRVHFKADPMGLEGAEVRVASLVLDLSDDPDRVRWSIDRWASDNRAMSGRMTLPGVPSFVGGRRVWHTEPRLNADGQIEFVPVIA